MPSDLDYEEAYLRVLAATGSPSLTPEDVEKIISDPEAPDLVPDSILAKKNALVREMIMHIDNDFLMENSRSGSTGTMCIVHPGSGGEKPILHVINMGDSRVLLSRIDGTLVDAGGTDGALTKDHKPDDEIESPRIIRAGGSVSIQDGIGRINDALSVARGFGDFKYKRSPLYMYKRSGY